MPVGPMLRILTILFNFAALIGCGQAKDTPLVRTATVSPTPSPSKATGGQSASPSPTPSPTSSSEPVADSATAAQHVATDKAAIDPTAFGYASGDSQDSVSKSFTLPTTGANGTVF